MTPFGKYVLAAALAYPYVIFAQNPVPAVDKATSIQQREQDLIRNAAVDCDRFETDRLVLYIDKTLLSSSAEQQYASELDNSIAVTMRHLHRKFDARRRKVPKPTYYLTNRAGISHAEFTRAFLLARQAIPNRGIGIHEAVHLLLMLDPDAPRNRDDLPPEEDKRWTSITGVWLIEGFASYIASDLAEQLHLPLSGPFLKGNNSTVDAEAREWLKDPRGMAVAPYIGSRGAPETLVSDRANSAAPFYVLGQSFVKFMVAHAGLSAVERLYENHTNGRNTIEEDVRRITRIELTKWRQQWIDSLTNAL